MTNRQMYTKLLGEYCSIFENYARKQQMNGKSLLMLVLIYEYPYQLSQEMIARKTFSTKQVVQANIKSFMEKGIVKMIPSQEDKRKKYIGLTEKGEIFVQQKIEPLLHFKEQAKSALTMQEQDQLRHLSKIYLDKLSELILTYLVTNHD